MYRKVTLTQVKKAIKEKGVFNGFAVGNKIHQSHFFNGWCLATNCKFTTIEEVDNFNNAMMAHMDSKMGDRVAWYEYL